MFATRVVRPKVGAINFAGFTPLLERIEAVIRDYAARKAAAAAPVPAAGAAAPAP